MTFITGISIIFILIGAGLLVSAGRQTIKKRTFLRNSTRTAGTIVGSSKVPSGTEVSFFPKVRFRTPAGQEVIFESKLGRGNRPPAIGEKVMVRYQPAGPDQAEIDSFMALWGLALLLGLLGGIFGFIGLGVLLGFIPV